MKFVLAILTIMFVIQPARADNGYVVVCTNPNSAKAGEVKYGIIKGVEKDRPRDVIATIIAVHKCSQIEVFSAHYTYPADCKAGVKAGTKRAADLLVKAKTRAVVLGWCHADPRAKDVRLNTGKFMENRNEHQRNHEDPQGPY